MQVVHTHADFVIFIGRTLGFSIFLVVLKEAHEFLNLSEIRRHKLGSATAL